MPVIIEVPSTQFDSILAPSSRKKDDRLTAFASDPINELLVFYHPARPEQFARVLHKIESVIDVPARQILIEAMVLEGPEAHGFPTPLWTCPRVARLIRDRFGVDYHEGHVWKLLRSLNWSPQRPVGKARERNEQAIREWKHKTWPAIKKKPKNKAARSSSSTKAD